MNRVPWLGAKALPLARSKTLNGLYLEQVEAASPQLAGWRGELPNAVVSPRSRPLASTTSFCFIGSWRERGDAVKMLLALNGI